MTGEWYNVLRMIKTIFYHGKKENDMRESSKHCGGRPAGRIKTAKIEISIEPEIKEEFMQIMRNEGKKASIEICDWIREYIKNSKLEEQE